MAMIPIKATHVDLNHLDIRQIGMNHLRIRSIIELDSAILGFICPIDIIMSTHWIAINPIMPIAKIGKTNL